MAIKIRFESFKRLSTNGRLEVDVSNLEAGMYLVMILSQNQMQIQKLIVTH